MPNTLQMIGSLLFYFALGVLTAAIVFYRRQILDAFDRLLRSTPRVDSFEQSLIEGSKETRFEKFPARRPYYFVREHSGLYPHYLSRLAADSERKSASIPAHLLRESHQTSIDQSPGRSGLPEVLRPAFEIAPRTTLPKNLPTYHFFIDDAVAIEQFMGFLLPSLDYGHGRKRIPAKNGIQLRFNPDWDQYLRKIGEKAKMASRNRALPRLSSKEKQLPLWSRIVFFDSDLLAAFLFSHEWIFKSAATAQAGSRFAQAVIDYVFDVVMIHNRMRLYDSIDCRYIASSAIAASEYYDFGLYRVEGVQIVYAPIYLMDQNMGIVKEKVFIGNTYRQRQRIREFIGDYWRLWQTTEKDCTEQATIQSLLLNGRITEEQLVDPASKLFGYQYLTTEFFDLIYCRKIIAILERQWGFRVPFGDTEDVSEIAGEASVGERDEQD